MHKYLNDSPDPRWGVSIAGDLGEATTGITSVHYKSNN